MQLHYVWVMLQTTFQLNTGFNGYVHFSVDYDSTDIAEILDIYKYLMVTNNIK